jgi:MFS family permease
VIAAVRDVHPSPRSDHGALAALRCRNYRSYLLGQSFANLGTWIQSIAQDWLVLRLTGSPAGVGITMALQFLPTLLLGVHGGVLADRWPRRRVLLATQSINAVLTGALAVLTLRGIVRAEDVYVFALLSGLVFVVDAPARQSFVSDVVPARHLRGAISLNAAVFQSARLVGPAIAGLLIATVGTGWAFAVNAACYLGPTIGLLRVHVVVPSGPTRPGRQNRAVRGTVRYVLDRPKVAISIVLVGVVGSLGLNFPIVLTAMASRTFHGDAGTYALYNVALAIGSVCGALAASTFVHSRLRLIIGGAASFGLAEAIAALAPNQATFLILLIAMGLANLAFQAIANSSVQLWVDPSVRGRVMGLYMLVFTGGTPLAAPLIGDVTNTYGPRIGMLVCGLAPVLAACFVVAWMSMRLRATTDGSPPTRDAAAFASSGRLCP